MRIDRPHRPARPRRATPAARLRDAVLALAEGQAILAAHRETPWASITFAGARHTLALAFEGAQAIAAGERFIAALPDHEFTLPRQLVADAAIVEVEHRLLPEPRLAVTVELLVLDDA